MAIQKAITLDSGISLTTAYHKISNIMIARDANNYVKFSVEIFADQTARETNKKPVKTVPCSCYDQSYIGLDALNAENANLFTQCYAYLKTQNNIEGLDYTTGVTDII